jgi:hypothetical protein
MCALRHSDEPTKTRIGGGRERYREAELGSAARGHQGWTGASHCGSETPVVDKGVSSSKAAKPNSNACIEGARHLVHSAFKRIGPANRVRRDETRNLRWCGIYDLAISLANLDVVRRELVENPLPEMTMREPPMTLPAVGKLLVTLNPRVSDDAAG